MLKRNSGTPLYIQLADILRNKIVLGEINIGDKLPSENEMVKKYSIGRLTVRDALSVLTNEGLVEKKHGSGTFCKACFSVPKYRVDVLLDLSDMYFIHHYLHSICSSLEDKNVSVVLHDTKNNNETIALCLEKILSEGTDGVILEPSSEYDAANEKQKDVFEKYVKLHIPYIMIDTLYSNVPKSYVIMNEFQSGNLAANYFKSMGHKKLCMITNSKNTDSHLRLKGFKETLGYEPYIVDYSSNLEAEIKKLFKGKDKITGIFCYNDNVARELFKILSVLKLKVPEDVSVVSVDDTVIASTLGLTSIVHEKSHLATTAAEAIMNIISGKATWPFEKIFEPSLKIRKSCRPL